MCRKIISTNSAWSAALHRVALVLLRFSLSEMKLLSILSSLMLDDAYKGRGKYHSKVSGLFLSNLSSSSSVDLSGRVCGEIC